MKSVRYFIVIICIVIIGIVFNKSRVIEFENIEDFKANDYNEETFLIFGNDKGDDYTSVEQVNTKNKVKQKYRINESFGFMQFSQTKNDYKKIYIGQYGGREYNIFYYDIDSEKFVKEELPLDEQYEIISDMFYSQNVIVILQDDFGKKYIYDYTNDILYNEIPPDFEPVASTIVTEVDDFIYYISNDCIVEYSKNTDEYNLYGFVNNYSDEELENKTTFDGEFDFFSPFFIPYEDSVLVSPISSNYLYKLNDGEFIKKFKYKDETLSYIYDIYYLNDKEVLMSYSEVEKKEDEIRNELYLVNTQDEIYKRLNFDYIKDDYSYEFLYEDDEYFYAFARKPLWEEDLKSEILVFDKNSFELIYKLTSDIMLPKFIIKK